MANDTMEKLNDTLYQYATSALANVSLPEYKGLPQEDVLEFIKRFKSATLPFNDDMKCLSLNKSLVGAAHVWAKENIKQFLKEGNWKAAKKAIIDRFSAPNQEIRHQEKLLKMKFNRADGTLTSYVEIYADLYRKAHKDAVDQDIIRSLSLNLPNDIIKHLNILSENWTTFGSIKELYSLIRRLEFKILPYEPDSENQEEKVSFTALSKMLKDIQESMKKQSDKLKEDSEEVVAAIQTRNYSNKQVYTQQPQRYQPYYYDRGRGGYRNNYCNNYRNDREKYDRNEPQLTSENNPRMLPITQPDQPMISNVSKVKENYYAKHGKPPSPCEFCGEDHFNKHCPYVDLE